MKWFVYEFETKLGDKVVTCYAGAPQTNLTIFLEKVSKLVEWVCIGGAFYINSHFIHSVLFDIFIFLTAVFFSFVCARSKDYILSKEEFINKINEITTE